MEKPLISVIMSVYNGEQHLRKSIDSVINQTYHNLEFLIIDDASTDASSDIIKSYRDDRIFYLKNEKNLGLTKSLNKALAFAKGDFVARIDHDDIYYKDKFEKQINFIIQNSDCKILFTDVQKIDDNDKILPSYSRIQTSEDIYYLMHFINPVIHPTVLIKTDILNSIGGYNENFVFAQDYELWSRLIYKYKLFKINEPLLYYRESKKQISKKNLKQQEVFAEKVFLNLMKNFGFKGRSDELIYFHKKAFKDDYKNIDKKKLSLFKKLNKKIIEKSPDFLDRKQIIKISKMNYFYYTSVYLRKFKVFNPFINLLKDLSK